MRLLITGATGKLGAYLVDEAIGRGHEVFTWAVREQPRRAELAHRRVNLIDRRAVKAALEQDCPEGVIHAAALSSEQEMRASYRISMSVNVWGACCIKEWCDAHRIPLLFTSTDMVFDGQRGGYTELDAPRPVLQYGRTKEQAEHHLARRPTARIVRLSLLYGPARGEREGFYDAAMADLRAGRARTFFTDEYRTPLDYMTAAGMLIRMIEEHEPGIWHLGGRERVSRYELMRRVARAQGMPELLLRGESLADWERKQGGGSPRPRDLSLDCAKLEARYPGLRPRTIEDAVAAWPRGA